MNDRRMLGPRRAGVSGKTEKPGGQSPEPASRWGIPLVFIAALVALWLGFRLVPDLGALFDDLPPFASSATPTLTIGSVTKSATPVTSPQTGANGQTPQASPTPRTAVPDLLQLSEERAVALLEQYGLTANVVPVFDENVAPGRVVAQFPERNAEVDEGSLVTVRVSQGPENPAMPDVVGSTVDNAREKLVLLGVEVEEVEQGSNTVPAGEVMGQEPAAGTEVEAGNTVRLIVSIGVDRVIVPDVRGKLFAIAQHELSGRGLRGELDIKLTNDSGPCGTVASQSRLPGTEVERDTVIKLNTSDEPGCTK